MSSGLSVVIGLIILLLSIGTRGLSSATLGIIRLYRGGLNGIVLDVGLIIDLFVLVVNASLWSVLDYFLGTSCVYDFIEFTLVGLEARLLVYLELCLQVTLTGTQLIRTGLAALNFSSSNFSKSWKCSIYSADFSSSLMS